MDRHDLNTEQSSEPQAGSGVRGSEPREGVETTTGSMWDDLFTAPGCFTAGLHRVTAAVQHQEQNLTAAPPCSGDPNGPSVWSTSGIRLVSPSLLRAR